MYNKPQINNVEINGNQNSEYYGLQSKIPFTQSDANKILSNNGTVLNWKSIDDELKLNSANPVQNAVVTSALNAKQNNITGAAETITTNNLATSKVVISNVNGKIDVSNTTSTEIDYVHGVTSNIQTQLNSKQATITGAATTVVSNDLTVNRALVSDNSGKISISEITATELGYLDGVTANIQNQMVKKSSGGSLT